MLVSASLFYSHSKQSEKMSNNSLALSKSERTVKNNVGSTNCNLQIRNDEQS